MSCLVCENRIPLLRQLAGNRFCSDEHSDRHAALQKSVAIARLSQPSLPPRPKPAPAQFALNEPVMAAQDSGTGARMFRDPLPRFSDVILSRRFLKPRFSIGVRGAKTVASVPGESAPPAPRPSSSGIPEARIGLRLALAATGALDVALRLSTASVGEVLARTSNPRPAVTRSAGRSAPIPKLEWAGPLQAPIGGLKPASMLSPRASEGDSHARTASERYAPIEFRLRLGSEADSHRPEWDWESARPETSLQAPAGLRHLQSAIPVWFDGVAPPPARASLLNGFGFHLENSVAPPESVRATPATAGFAPDEPDTLAAITGFSGPLFVACDFPICPVWLPALFDDVGGMRAGLRRLAFAQPFPPVVGSREFQTADGPGFCGLLACPPTGAPVQDFHDVPMPAPNAAASTEAQAEPLLRPESPWERGLKWWRKAPVLARSMALAVPLMAPTLFYGPKIALQTQSASSGSSWAAAIRARATVNLQEDFQSGFRSWSGKPGWEKTWSIDGSGSAQPGRLALYRETVPLTDYRLEFQAQIQAKALGFALRAADTNNYQAVKIAILKPGPLATIALVRYPVIEGREGPKTQLPISLTLRSDTLYKILVTVQGDHFSVTVNDQFADAWSDGRFKSGGVGFFADKGEVARLRSVHVIDKEDFLGWFCYQVSQWTADRRASGVKHE